MNRRQRPPDRERRNYRYGASAAGRDGNPFENTNTVPEMEGLETGQAPNATDERS